MQTKHDFIAQNLNFCCIDDLRFLTWSRVKGLTFLLHLTKTFIFVLSDNANVVLLIFFDIFQGDLMLAFM